MMLRLLKELSADHFVYIPQDIRELVTVALRCQTTLTIEH